MIQELQDDSILHPTKTGTPSGRISPSFTTIADPSSLRLTTLSKNE